MHPAKLVVVGPGLIGKQHIRLIGESSACQLVAIVAPDHSENHATATARGVPIHHSLEACLAETDVDGVIVSSPNEFHAAQASLCVTQGIPVLVEKPITSSVEDGMALVARAREHGVPVLVGHHRAHSPLLSRARSVIEEGSLGRLVSVMGSAQFAKPRHYFEEGPWRTLPGGGPILINLIHEIGNLRSLCGEISAVQAIVSSATRSFEVEDTVAINLLFANGCLGTFMLSDAAATAASWEQTSRENPAYPTYPDEDCYLLAGTKGSLSIPTMRLKFHAEGIEPSWWAPFTERTLDVDRQDPLACQLEHFVRVIRGKERPLVSAEDGLRNLEVTEAIRASAIQRRLIEV
ncbi:Gfo/Idh/MocA family oxidoreductase [Luteimonas vadosa]|uniref:Gfo/Idh/MocA family oxidoreductase n=1 Tax=Luteimonas vadosa TaxID=1165507 RepID=A0ABP9DMH1_9GAMM